MQSWKNFKQEYGRFSAGVQIRGLVTGEEIEAVLQVREDGVMVITFPLISEPPLGNKHL